jgi:hypothetical protein
MKVPVCNVRPPVIVGVSVQNVCFIVALNSEIYRIGSLNHTEIVKF